MGTVQVIRRRERFTKCASCRSDMMFMVLVSGEAFASACARHVETWKRRAGESITP